MPLTYSDSFDGVAIRVLADGHSEDIEAQVAVRAIPGGTDVYIDVGGTSPPTLTVQVLVPSDASYVLLRQKVGRRGTLSLPATLGTVTAVLVALRGRLRLPSGVNRVTAEFLLG